MEQAVKNEILALGRKAHEMTESAYQQHGASRGEANWPEKQRILLADMSLHLLQTALADGELSAEQLQRNLYAILTISDQFIPGRGMKDCAAKLLES